MTNLLKDLNDRQREAVTAPPGPVLVLAGAGSGKTRVLTYRIAWLLEQGWFKPEELLALTFTNKAAGEMRSRIIGLIGKSENQKSDFPTSLPVRQAGDSRLPITMGTFHSVCARILRQEIENLGRGYSRRFVIYDTEDRERVLKQIILELGVGEQFRPQVFAYWISQAKNRLLTPKELDLENSPFQDLLVEVFERYQRSLQEQNALDFDDLLILVCKLFSDSNDSNQHSNNSNEFVNSNRSINSNRSVNSSRSETLKKYQDKFKYILVDEYQDTNHAQYMILKLLAGASQNLFVVGDDAQSIYGFRGANMRNILDFKKDYRKAKVYMLEQNYRSSQGILDVAGEVIKLNPYQYEKKLWTDKPASGKVNLYAARDEMDEAQFVLGQIIGSRKIRKSEELIYESEQTPILNRFIQDNRPKRFFVRFSDSSDLSESVILYRTHAQSRPFEELLVASGIPYQIVGGVKFYERQEIKDTLAYLRLAVNPKDLVSLSRIINVPTRGIGPVAFKELNEALRKYKYDYNRLLDNIDELDLSPRALAGAREFFGMLVLADSDSNAANDHSNDSNEFVNSNRLSLLDIMHLLLTRSGYKQELLRGGEEELTRWENIEGLFNAAAKYKDMSWQEAAEAFLQEVALLTDIDTVEENGGKLTLMTLHSAKGLEFDKVFLVGVEEGLLPHSRSLLNREELAEEIRLAYVGITRAKQDLYLSYARQRQSYGEIKRCAPSRVIKAIPKKLLHKLN